MIYIVSSFNRSGSSMMMRCLTDAGMDSVWDKTQDRLNLIYGRDGYVPNLNGFYALHPLEFALPNFTEVYEGKLVKCPFHILGKLPEYNYKMVFMLRDPKSIRESMNTMRFINTWEKGEAITWFYDLIYPSFLQKINYRGNFDIMTLWYEDILSQPNVEFSKLLDSGWNIDVQVASSLVDVELNHSSVLGT